MNPAQTIFMPDDLAAGLDEAGFAWYWTNTERKDRYDRPIEEIVVHKKGDISTYTSAYILADKRSIDIYAAGRGATGRAGDTCHRAAGRVQPDSGTTPGG